MSLDASDLATYSTSTVDFALQDFFILLQEMAPPDKVKTYPGVEIRVCVSNMN